MADCINSKLSENLPQLQNLIKRDPESYRDDLQAQYRQFTNNIEQFQLQPEQPNRMLEAVIMFLAHVSKCYPDDLSSYPQLLMDLLQKHGTALNGSMRMALCKALILLRNQNLLQPTDLLELFFQLLKCQDKALREFLQSHLITDIKNINAKHKNAKLNTTLQNFMYSMLRDSNARAAKMSVDIMAELYKKNVWNDAKTVNVIATGCFSKFPKVMVASLKFFLGKDPDEKNSDDSDSEDEVDTREVIMANKFNKKTRKREKQLNKVKKLASKAYKKKSQAPSFNFSALQLIHDPQGMAEKLFHQLEATTKRFEIKILTLDIISRLIGLHDLILFNFYPYVQRFMQPHQREVTRILQFVAQASHELVPPDVLEPVLKTLANNFITERNSSDVMAIGLNAVREICARCPLAINEDLLKDLAMYKNYKDRSVMMGAKSLIHLFRTTRPDLLHKKDRGRPTEATAEITPMSYGQVKAKDYVPGAEVLMKSDTEEVEIDSESGSDDEQWIDIKHSSDDEAEQVVESGNSESDSDGSGSDEEQIDDNDDSIADQDKSQSDSGTSQRKILKAKRRSQDIQSKKDLAQKISLDRILTDEDFKRIDMANVKKQVTHFRKGEKRRLEESLVDEKPSGSGLVKLGDIENIYKKRKHDKQTRIDSVREGQKDREKFGYKDGRLNIHCSKTNREKRKTKNYQMIKHKIQRKTKRSFKDKQIALRNHLLKIKKMK